MIMLPFILALVFIGLLGIVYLWIATAVKGHRLLNEFKQRMPDRAKELVPELFMAGRNPKKALFFLTKTAGRAMSDDLPLLKMRNEYLVMTWTSVIAPFVIVGVPAILIWILSSK